MPDRWTSPAYAEYLKSHAPITVMGSCSNCGGSGRIIYTDSDGKMKDMACLACGGSGQSPE